PSASGAAGQNVAKPAEPARIRARIADADAGNGAGVDLRAAVRLADANHDVVLEPEPERRVRRAAASFMAGTSVLPGTRISRCVSIHRLPASGRAGASCVRDPVACSLPAPGAVRAHAGAGLCAVAADGREPGGGDDPVAAL